MQGKPVTARGVQQRGERLRNLALSRVVQETPTAETCMLSPPETTFVRILGRSSRVMLNSGEAVPVHYAVVEAAALITSHRGLNYERDPRYPTEAQPRDYSGEKEAQWGVEERARRLDPWQLLSNSVLPVDGPPIVRRDGIVISGNGRAQSMRLAILRDVYGDVAAGINERAESFGLDRDTLSGLEHPVLVRLLDVDVQDSLELARYGLEMNRDPAQGMSSIEQAMALSRLVTPAVVAKLANLIAELPSGSTVREFLRRRAKDVSEILSAGGLIDSRKRSVYFTGEGDLTEAGKELVETTLAGLTVTDIGVLRAASIATRDRLVRVGGHFLRMKSAGREWDLARYNNEAVKLLTTADDRAAYLRTLKSRDGVNDSLVERHLHPERFANAASDMGLCGSSSVEPAVEALARALEQNPRDYAATLERYTHRALRGANSMFESTHPADVFTDTVGALWGLAADRAEWGGQASSIAA